MAKQHCDLCGLPIAGPPYELHTAERAYVFCCDACKGIFHMLNDVEEVSKSDSKEPPRNEDKR